MRGYFVPPKDGPVALNYKCHNCGTFMTMWQFLEWFDGDLFKQYRLDSFKEKYGDSRKRKPTVKKKTPSIEALQSDVITRDEPKVLLEAPPVSLHSVLDEVAGCYRMDCVAHDQMIYQYISKRQIPEEFYSKLYYAPNFQYLIETIAPEYRRSPSEPRLIIPFYDENGRLIFVQGRSLEKDSIAKYLTIPIGEKVDKIYGLERVDRTKPVIVVEGPLDSMFVRNCLAAADADLTHVKGDIYTFDRQPRLHDIVKRMGRAINNGKRVTIWDRLKFSGKDINDAIISGISPPEITEYILQNSPSGAEARLRFNRWKKVSE